MAQHIAQPKVLAFDIGIKNLAFCVLDKGDTVLALENCTLIEPIQAVICSNCKLKASFQVDHQPFCKKHIPKTHTVLPELSKKKLPPHKILKDLVKKHDCEQQGTSKAITSKAITSKAITSNAITSNEKCIQSLSKKFALPLQQPKEQNASKMSLEAIHDGLRLFIKNKSNVFSGCTHVLLENQPVFKNPHMKSVQVLLFASLRDWYLDNEEKCPTFHMVHAKKKVNDAPKGDAGYAERKQKSEDRVTKLFEEKQLNGATHYEEWKKSKKKSDMADAICMAVDLFGLNETKE